MFKKVILVVSFGTSYKETREKTIDAFEKAVAERFPDWEVRRAFTSKMIIKKLKERDGIHIDYVEEALQRLVDDGVSDVAILPTHIMNGVEYDDVARITAKYAEKFQSIILSKPLLSSDEDYDDAIEALNNTYFERFFGDSSDNTAIVMMGHGSDHHANAVYSQMQLKLFTLGFEHVYITTVEGYPSFDDTMRLMAGHKYSKIVLIPFMMVAGDHATNDMAGDEEDSLKSKFESAGCDVKCVLEGLGEQKPFQNLFIERFSEMIKE